jgi:hypothetical protein
MKNIISIKLAIILSILSLNAFGMQKEDSFFNALGKQRKDEQDLIAPLPEEVPFFLDSIYNDDSIYEEKKLKIEGPSEFENWLVQHSASFFGDKKKEILIAESRLALADKKEEKHMFTNTVGGIHRYEIPKLNGSEFESEFETSSSASIRKKIDTFIIRLGDKHQFEAPESIVVKSETIKEMREGCDNKDREIFLPGHIDPVLMNKVIEIMWSVHRHQSLNGRALLDAIASEVKLNNFDKPNTFNKPFELLQLLSYLNFKEGMDFAARHIGATTHLAYDHAKLKKFKLMEFLPTIARFFYLIKGNDLDESMISKNHYGFSIRDYLDYQPHRIKVSKSGSLYLKELRLTSLEGLQDIQNIASVTNLDLSCNALTKIEDGSFKCMPQLLVLFLNNNNLNELNEKAFLGLPNLRIIDLYDNQNLNESEISKVLNLINSNDQYSSQY